MVEKRVLVCDLCEQMPAVKVVVEIDGYRSRMDLCEQHRSPVQDLLDKATIVAASDGGLNFADIREELGL